MLVSRRRQRFVGRAAEIELFRACLDAESPAFAVLFVHGPGGIGKSTLLDAFAVAARREQRRLVRVDARDLLPSPEGVRRAVDTALREPLGDRRDRSGRTVVLLDSYERLAALDDWVREQLLPDLPANVVTVLAGRQPPAPGWRADPAWRELLRVIGLRNLTPEEGREYLRRCGVAEAMHGRLLEVSYGHPLGLSLLADQAVRHGSIDLAADSPDLVAALVQRFLGSVPTFDQRQALEACALARVTTEPLLRAALDAADVRELFDWLRDLSFVEAGPEGLFPHDLARDVIDRDLRWRDPDSYQIVFRRVQASPAAAASGATVATASETRSSKDAASVRRAAAEPCSRDSSAMSSTITIRSTSWTIRTCAAAASETAPSSSDSARARMPAKGVRRSWESHRIVSRRDSSTARRALPVRAIASGILLQPPHTRRARTTPTTRPGCAGEEHEDEGAVVVLADEHGATRHGDSRGQGCDEGDRGTEGGHRRSLPSNPGGHERPERPDDPRDDGREDDGVRLKCHGGVLPRRVSRPRPRSCARRAGWPYPRTQGPDGGAPNRKAGGRRVDAACRSTRHSPRARGAEPPARRGASTVSDRELDHPGAALRDGAVGALVGRMVPALAGPDSSRVTGRARRSGRRHRDAVVGLLIFFLILNGFDGA